MPYPSNADLPSVIRTHLAPHAQSIYRRAFNHAWERYGEREALAHRIAWSAVKRSYVKRGDAWVRKGRWHGLWPAP